MNQTNSSYAERARLCLLKRLLFFTILLFASTSVFAQNISLSVKNVSMEEALRQVEKKSGFRILYNAKTLEDCKPVTVNLKSTPLESVLRAIFKGQPITYTIVRDAIIIRKTEEPRASSEQPAVLQKAIQLIPVSGSVTNEKGEVLAGVNITIENTSIRFATDNQGEFSIATVPDDGVMIISHIGYEVDTVAILGQSRFAIKLKLFREKLDEVTVSTGYQQLNKERATGSFSKPDMEVFQARTGTMDVISRLDGLVPGLTVIAGPNGVVTTNERLGNGNSTQQSVIRGKSSVLLASDPLYVVNGVPVADFSTINPDDIADITVLKDAAATAIWGARAANGVIVVNTKSGSRNNKMKIGYSGFVNFMGKPDFGYGKVLNSKQYVELGKETFDPVDFPYFTLATAYITPHEQILYNQNAGTISAAQASKSLDSLASINNMSQIKDLFYRNAITTSHTLSFSGGMQNYSFYGSFSNVDLISNKPGQTDRTYRINLNQEMNINKRLKFSLLTALSNNIRTSKKIPDISNLFIPYQLFQDSKGNSLNMDYVQGLSPATRADYQSRSLINLDYNPLDEINYGFTKTNNLAINLTGEVTFKIIKGLNYEGTYSYQKAPGTITSYDDSKEYALRSELLSFTVAPPGAAPVYYLPTTGGTYSVTNTDQRSWVVRNQLIYNTLLRGGKDHLNVQFGQEAREQLNAGTETTLRGYDLNLQTFAAIDYKALSNGVFGTVSSFRSVLNQLPFLSLEETTRFNSYFSLASYTFNDKYSLDASWRMDHSNLIGTDVSAQNKPVYSIGGKWNISKESFLRSTQWINNLAVRGTYGITGNSPYIGSAAIEDILAVEYGLSAPIAGTGVTVNSPGNAKLNWESTKTFNEGIDFSILQSRISGSIELYQKTTTNLLGSTIPNPLTGFTSVRGNIGQLNNKGLEISLRSANIQHRDFSWTTSVTFAYNKSKLVSYQAVQSFLNNAIGKVGSSYLVGYSMASLFAFNYAGLDKNGNPQIRLANGKISSDPTIAQPADIIYKGTTVPVFNGGFSNTFRYKALSLTANMIYSLGHVMRKDINDIFSGRITGSQSGFTGNVNSYFLNRWQKTGDEAHTDIPGYIPNENIFTSTRDLDYYRYASTNVVSASYCKLRDITLSYQLPKLLLDKVKIASASCYIQATNFMVWKANKADIDPEYNNAGFRMIPPFKHSFSIGANINF